MPQTRWSRPTLPTTDRGTEPGRDLVPGGTRPGREPLVDPRTVSVVARTRRVKSLYVVVRGMPEETLFEFERDMDTVEVAQYLRTVADHLESGDEFTLESGSESVTLTPPGRVEFEVEVERETSKSGGSAEIEIEFELEWDEDATGTGDLTIE
jgi:amphi-Trp domain-containing protein